VGRSVYGWALGIYGNPRAMTGIDFEDGSTRRALLHSKGLQISTISKAVLIRNKRAALPAAPREAPRRTASLVARRGVRQVTSDGSRLRPLFEDQAAMAA